MRCKKGIFGGLISGFWATVVIVVILVVFVVGSSVIKMVVRSYDDVDGELSVYNESRVGIDDVFNYMINYEKLVRLRSFDRLESGISEVGYEE